MLKKKKNILQRGIFVYFFFSPPPPPPQSADWLAPANQLACLPHPTHTQAYTDMRLCGNASHSQKMVMEEYGDNSLKHMQIYDILAKTKEGKTVADQ